MWSESALPCKFDCNLVGKKNRASVEALNYIYMPPGRHIKKAARAPRGRLDLVSVFVSHVSGDKCSCKLQWIASKDRRGVTHSTVTRRATHQQRE